MALIDRFSGDIDDRRMSLGEHLEELRKRMFLGLTGFAVAFFVFMVPAIGEHVVYYVCRPLFIALARNGLPPQVHTTDPAEAFMTYIKAAMISAAVIAGPWMLYQLWLFIAPGLYKRERHLAAPFIIFGSLFFIAGGYFGYRFLLPATCGFFVETGKQFKQMITVDDYFSFSSVIILATGVVFETPILIFFLARLGIVTPAFLMQKFKYAIVLAFVIAAIITPTLDMVTQAALAVPMILLYLIGVGVAFLFAKPVE